MHETPTRIKFKKTLGKRPDIFLIPGRFARDWLAIVTGCAVLYLLLNPFIPIDPWEMGALCSTLIMSHWILVGDAPWKYGGKFHKARTMVKGYPKFDLNLGNASQNPLKQKVGLRRVGTKIKRVVDAIEDELDLVCPVRFELKGKHVGAYLLQKNRTLRVVWAFKWKGINSTLSKDEAQKIAELIESGLKQIPQGEELTINVGTFSSDQERVAELRELMKRSAGVPENEFLLKWAISRVQRLTQLGKHNPKFLRIYLTYTLDGGTSKSQDWIERILGQAEQFWKAYVNKGKGEQQYRQQLEASLNNAFNYGYMQSLQLLENSLKWQVEPMTEEEIWLCDWKKFNKGNAPPIPQLLILNQDGLDWQINSRVHITTELFASGCPILDKQWVQIPGINSYVGAAIWEKKPLKEYIGVGAYLAQLLDGSAVLNEQSVSNTEIVVQFTQANQAIVQKDTQDLVKQANMNATIAQNRQRLDPGAIFNTRKSLEDHEQLLEGKHAIRFGWVALVYRPTPEALNRAMQNFTSLFEGAVVTRETGYTDQIWLEALPFTWRRLLTHPYQRQILDTTEVAPALMPLVHDQTPDTHGVEFISTHGNTPLYFAPFDRPQHTIVLGKTGAGKTEMFSDVILHFHLRDFNTFIIDSTRGDGSGSFDAITEFLGGAYFNTTTESNNLLQTPDFRVFQESEEYEAKFNLYRDTVLSGLMVLSLDKESEGKTRRLYKQIFNLVLHEYFKDANITQRYNAAHDSGFGSSDWQKMPTLHDLIKFIHVDYMPAVTSDIKQAISAIRLQLESCLVGKIGRAIASPSTFRTDSRLVVYALGNIDDDQDAAPLALSAYSSAITRALTVKKVFLPIDEGSYLFNYESFAEIAGAVCAKGRKAGIWFALLGQDLKSIKRSSVSSQILDNITTYLVGQIEFGAIAALVEEGIPEEILKHNTSRSFQPANSEFARQWLIRTADSCLFGNHYPSFAHHALLMNNTDEVEARKVAYAEAKGDKFKAINALANEFRANSIDGRSKQFKR
jgi:hypothetical protein